jgi:hypothetical protein
MLVSPYAECSVRVGVALMMLVSVRASVAVEYP